MEETLYLKEIFLVAMGIFTVGSVIVSFMRREKRE